MADKHLDLRLDPKIKITNQITLSGVCPVHINQQTLNWTFYVLSDEENTDYIP